MIDTTPELILFGSDRFRARLASALTITATALAGARRPYVAFSSGKDSVCVAALVHAVLPTVPLLWSDDELEYSEVVSYMTDLRALAGDQLIVTLGWAQHANWFWPWTDRPWWREPFPGAIHVGQDVDDWMGTQGYDLTFTGVRASESRKRRDWLLTAGPLYPVKRGTGRRCCPIWDWTEDDVWALIAGWHLAYNPVYDRLTEIRVPRKRQRVGPLPLAQRDDLAAGWPDMLTRLEARYGRRWS